MIPCPMFDKIKTLTAGGKETHRKRIIVADNQIYVCGYSTRNERKREPRSLSKKEEKKKRKKSISRQKQPNQRMIYPRPAFCFWESVTYPCSSFSVEKFQGTRCTNILTGCHECESCVSHCLMTQTNKIRRHLKNKINYALAM